MLSRKKFAINNNNTQLTKRPSYFRPITNLFDVDYSSANNRIPCLESDRYSFAQLEFAHGQEPINVGVASDKDAIRKSKFFIERHSAGNRANDSYTHTRTEYGCTH